MEASAVRETTGQTRTSARPAGLRYASRDVVLRRLLGLGDALMALIALDLAMVIPGRHHGYLWGLFAAPLMVFLCKLYGLYDRDMKRISHSTVDDLPWLAHAVVIGVLIIWAYSKYTPMMKLGLEELVLLVSALAILLPLTRAVIRHSAGRLLGPERALMVGQGPMAEALLRKLRSHPEYQVDVIASLDVEAIDAPGVASNVDRLTELVERHGVTRVVLAVRDLEELDLVDLLRHCRTLSLKVSILPSLSDALGAGVEIDDVEGITVLGLSPPQLPRSSWVIKRVIDVLTAGVLLLLFSPVLLLVALAIKLDSRGPVLFRQERIGRGGRRFRLYKLRTMVADAEERRADLITLSSDPNWLFVEGDPRVTRVGRRLRRLSLDELPQLWNVLRGEMSMVGPRPLVPAENDRVQDWARGRLDLTPGLTGYWQVLGRTRIPFEEMVKLDYLYVMNWSLWEDIRLMLRTLPVILSGRGAN